jgi:Flp pilus assembly protein TadD
MEAVVFPRHVVVRAPGSPDQVFEMLQHGATLPMAQLRIRLGADGAHATRVRPRAFPAFYLDNLAVRFADAGDAARAESMFQQAIDASPRVARARFNYGTFLLGKDRLKPAEEQLRRAVRLDSRNAPAWANLGVAVARLGDATEARRCFERALRYDPGNRTAAENLKALGRDGPPAPR